MAVFTEHTLMKDLHRDGGKIVLLVLDGLGGLPLEPGGQTELEAAETPNLDRLAADGTTGLSIAIRPGVEPGSGPAHLSLFSYDPVKYEIGRGVLEAMGIGFELEPDDLAARGNFASAAPDGTITDRRAGRISTEECIRLVEKLQQATGNALPGYEIFVKPVKEHRFVLVIRGEGLDGDLTETDPLVTGKKTAAGGGSQRYAGRGTHGRVGQPMGSNSPKRPGRRTPGQQSELARPGQRSRPAPFPRHLRAASRRYRRLPDVSRRRPAGGYGDRRV